MTLNIRAGLALVALAVGLAGCGGSGSSVPVVPSAPSAGPSPAPQPASNNALVVFTEPGSGFSTSDVRDAHDHIVQFTMGNELIWIADGTRLPDHLVQGPGHELRSNLAAEPSCQCWLVVRFGTSNGERRAYLTGDVGHFNPGTLVDLEIAGGALIVSPTDLFPPGRFTLSGVITEATARGLTPIENAEVWRLSEEKWGWNSATTDKNGFYQIHGLSDGSRVTSFSKEGYQKVEQTDLSVHGDTRVDMQLVRR